jgi:predicted RNA methylase
MAAGAVARAEREALRARVALAVADAAGHLGPASISSLKDIELLESELSRATGWRDADRRTNEHDAESAEAAKLPIEPERGSGAHAFDHYRERMVGLARMGVLAERQLRETLVALVALRSCVDRPTEDPVRALERRLVGFNAPGFFPTPRPLAAQMAELAEIGHGTRVLEPSAGSGRLADAARDRGGFVTCIECNHTLHQLLIAKGHRAVLARFPETPLAIEAFDAVVMNPPFEDGQDGRHVREAFERLVPGGRLVAITGEHPWFANDVASTRFRAWVATVCLFHDEKLPAETFNASDVTQRTGVATRLIGIRKAAR